MKRDIVIFDECPQFSETITIDSDNLTRIESALYKGLSDEVSDIIAYAAVHKCMNKCRFSYAASLAKASHFICISVMGNNFKSIFEKLYLLVNVEDVDRTLLFLEEE